MGMSAKSEPSAAAMRISANGWAYNPIVHEERALAIDAHAAEVSREDNAELLGMLNVAIDELTNLRQRIAELEAESLEYEKPFLDQIKENGDLKARVEELEAEVLKLNRWR